MYDKLLVPTDGSETAEVAIDHAVELAELYDAAIQALYVIDVDAVNLTLGTEQVDRLKAGKLDEMVDLKARATDALDAVAEAAGDHGIEVEEEIAVGRPPAEIAEYAEDEDIDLVVMGSHGRSGISRRIMGSVTERVLRSTTAPVLVVDEKGEAKRAKTTAAETPA